MSVLQQVSIHEVERVRADILQYIEELIAEWQGISQSSIDHFGGKITAAKDIYLVADRKLTQLISQKKGKNDDDR